MSPRDSGLTPLPGFEPDSPLVERTDFVRLKCFVEERVLPRHEDLAPATPPDPQTVQVLRIAARERILGYDLLLPSDSSSADWFWVGVWTSSAVRVTYGPFSWPGRGRHAR
jgi:hypothetical protein